MCSTILWSFKNYLIFGLFCFFCSTLVTLLISKQEETVIIESWWHGSNKIVNLLKFLTLSALKCWQINIGGSIVQVVILIFAIPRVIISSKTLTLRNINILSLEKVTPCIIDSWFLIIFVKAKFVQCLFGIPYRNT